MSSISLFDIISVVFRDPKIFLCIPASAADAAAVNPKGIKKLLASGFYLLMVILFLVSNLPRNPPDCIVFDNWVFDNLISADE